MLERTAVQDPRVGPLRYLRRDSSGLAWDAALPREISLRLRWLGQAGFLLEAAGARVLVDPYLSDSLAGKYRGKLYPHRRMAPPPARPEELGRIDLCICTHGHGDHLDPGTLGPLAAAAPSCSFVVPSACLGLAEERGVPASRLLGADAFTPLRLGEVELHPIPAAHGELSIDGAGHHRFLGYALRLGGLTVYHSGDCVPYAGLAANLGPLGVDIGLLPVNGRKAELEAAGILGNFSLEEAEALASSLGFGLSLGHHFGMFDFNTIDVDAASLWLQRRGSPFRLAETGVAYEFGSF